MTTVDELDQPVGVMLREWRRRRRISQLDLSIETGVSTRHLSFVETGRSKPSSDMILRLADHLGVPPREQNRLLLRGGYAPAHPEHDLDDADLAVARSAIRTVLVSHEPYPAVAVDRMWDVVDANAGIELFTRLASPTLLEGRVNALRLTLHPDGVAPYIVNLPQWRATVLDGLRRSASARADAEMLELYDELVAYPGGGEDDARSSDRRAVYVPLILRVDGVELAFVAIIAAFGTAIDITLGELAIESFLPANQDTADYLHLHVSRSTP